MEPLVGNIAGNIAFRLAETMNDLGSFLLALLLAAPAVAWSLQTTVERKWPVVRRSHLASAFSAAALTVLATIAILIATRIALEHLPDGYQYGRDWVYIAVALVVIAIGIQISERHSFTWTRATALASSSLTLIISAKIYDLFEYIAK